MDLNVGVLQEDNGMLVGTTNNIVVIMIVGPLDLHHVKFVLEGHMHVRSQGFEKVGGITLLDARVVPTVKAEVRAAMTKLAEETAPWALCNCEVIDGDGVGVVLLRSVLKAINMATQTKWPNRVCHDIQTGATWISQFMKPVPGPAEVEVWAAAVETIYRARLQRARAARA